MYIVQSWVPGWGRLSAQELVEAKLVVPGLPGLEGCEQNCGSSWKIHPEKSWKNHGKSWKSMENHWENHGKSWKISGKPGKSWKISGKVAAIYQYSWWFPGICPVNQLVDGLVNG